MFKKNPDDIFHQLWSHRWLSAKTEVKPSSICATGVFAKEKINKSEIVRVTGGIILPKKDAAKYNKILGYVVDNVYLDISDDFAMAPTSDDLKRTATINHSCEPNIGFLDTVTLVAIKDINPGEELGWDYAFSQTLFEPFDCKCGKPACRKRITPQDWKIKTIQEKYRDYYSPYLKAKI